MAYDPFYQRCYPELLTALANTDINATLIKTPVKNIIFIDFNDTWD